MLANMMYAWGISRFQRAGLFIALLRHNPPGRAK